MNKMGCRGVLIIGSLLTVTSVGCRRDSTPSAAPAPPKVSVAHPEQRELVDFDEYIGWIEPAETVDVRARVRGYIEKVAFEDGAVVQKGDLLFALDPRPFQVMIDESLARAKALEAQELAAQKTVARNEQLVKNGAVSVQELEESQSISLDAINATLQTYLGSAYVNDFSFQDRNWQVNVQADPAYRLTPDDIGQLEVRNAQGNRVPLRTLIRIRDTTGPPIVNHYNLYPSAELNGNTAPGVSSSQGIVMMEQLADQFLPSAMSTEWTELTYQQILASKDLLTKLVFPLGVVFVFLVLAAQYESWSLPLAIILIVPMCILAALTGVWLAGLNNDIFVQIGLVVLIGLAAKNAILIVEFAKQSQDQGKPRIEATVDACRMRLRPILMTSFAFILGVVPLVLAKGAGAEMRFTLGLAVFSGMVGVTIFGIFFTPVFYSVIMRLGEKSPAASQAPAGKKPS